MVVGHAHPKIIEAIERAIRSGSHFAVPTEDTVLFAEELCRRFNLEQVRFANSGTEATMSAIRIARAATGRDDIVKIEGSYHGHHDAVMFSVVPNADLMGGREQPASEPTSLGIPKYLRGHTHAVPFNDLEVLSKLLDERGDEIACLIIEPVMMNIGIAVPDPGYLAGLLELLHRHGALLIFDEVKSGATIAAGGAIERYGVQPDLACFAKAIGGGTPAAAFGGRADVMEVIARGAAHQGTFNANPLVCAAGLRRSPRCSPPTRTCTWRRWAPASPTDARPRSMPTASRPTRWTSGRRAACRTGPSRCGTTATSSRRTPISTRRRTRGWSTAGSS